MTTQRLDNYLRTYRRRAGLTQEEVAFLLGSESGTSISRYEHHSRIPNLETILAYEAVFRVPAGELFAGRLETIQQDVAKRADQLVEQLGLDVLPDPKSRKKQALKAIRGGGSPFWPA